MTGLDPTAPENEEVVAAASADVYATVTAQHAQADLANHAAEMADTHVAQKDEQVSALPTT
jgi:hypothetical protein